MTVRRLSVRNSMEENVKFSVFFQDRWLRFFVKIVLTMQNECHWSLFTLFLFSVNYAFNFEQLRYYGRNRSCQKLIALDISDANQLKCY